ncbi:MAG: succinylglutamate desuccinylase/aspartoacylase family protein [Solobacterium sp.]|nr:succinylglutamate desuccinylase/aspartoacylase family protein [Solobacterium sp.]
MFVIASQSVRKGTKKQCMTGPDGYPMPATVIAGAQEGKTVLVTAQIHSGEYPGTPAAVNTAKRIDPLQVHGNIIIVHCVNVSGFCAGTDAYVPEDGGNLNACYPGDKDTVSGRIAQFFINEIFPHVDFVLDLHSGGMTESLTPCLFWPGIKVSEESLRVAKALDIPYLVQSFNRKGECGYAANVLGIPGLLLERGGSGLCRKEWVEAYERDIALCLNALGILPCTDTEVCDKKVIRKAVYLTAEEDGIWFPAVREGQHVEKGQVLGHTEDFFGDPLRTYHAEDSGIILYYTSGLRAKKGSSLAAYSLDAYTEDI